MGLWDDIFEQVKLNKIELSPFKIKTDKDIVSTCIERRELVENGWLEGFWGGRENIKCPNYIAQILDSLSDLATLYGQLANRNPQKSEFDNLVKTISHTDKMVNRSIAFIIENYVLPRFEKIQSKTN